MFSPIIKMTKKGYFHIALSISNHSSFIEYLYIVEQQKDGTFKVIQDMGDDWPGIGNTKELSELKIKE